MRKLLFFVLAIAFGFIARAQEPAQSKTFEKSKKNMTIFVDKLKAAGFEMSDEEHAKLVDIYTEAYEYAYRCKEENPGDKEAADACAKLGFTARNKKLTEYLGAERAKKLLSLHKIAHAQK